MSDNKNENISAVFEYETYMLISLKYLLSHNLKTDNAIQRALTNALVESILLHIRILSDIFLSRVKSHEDEINLYKIIDLENIIPVLEKLIEELDNTYGKSRQEGSHCWTINKMLAHASDLRGSNYDYRLVINELYPILIKIISEINKVVKNPNIDSSLAFSDRN